VKASGGIGVSEIVSKTNREEVARSCTNATLRVLHLLTKGRYAEQVASELKMHPSSVSRHIQKLTDTGLITLDVRSFTKQYILTKRGEIILAREEVAFSSTSTTMGCHDIYIKLPIIKKPATQPDGLWDRVNHDFKNSFQYHRFCDAIDSSMRETTKHICVQLRPRTLNNYDEVYGLIAAAIGYTIADLSPYGYVLDVMHPKVEGIHLTHGDEKSKELLDKGLRVSVELGRDRAKFFQGDPAQPAKVWLDTTPTKNFETNDHEHAKLRALEPELVAQTAQRVDIIERNLTILTENMAAHVRFVQRSAHVMDRLDHALCGPHARVQHTLRAAMSQRRLSDFRGGLA
jgi:DNA-binding transcriptional ArsR family regulator